jgi:hypothetical protein
VSFRKLAGKHELSEDLVIIKANLRIVELCHWPYLSSRIARMPRPSVADFSIAWAASLYTPALRYVAPDMRNEMQDIAIFDHVRRIFAGAPAAAANSREPPSSAIHAILSLSVGSAKLPMTHLYDSSPK